MAVSEETFLIRIGEEEAVSLAIAAAKNKKDVFNEIKKNYAKYTQVTRTGGDKARIWEEKHFDFTAPKEGWLNDLKTLSKVEVGLKYSGVAGKFNVQLTGQAKAGGTVVATVGTIMESTE